jgi:peptide deformylase
VVKYLWKEGKSMIKTSDILDEKDKRVRAHNKEVEFPLTDERKKLINDMLEHLYYSQIEEYAEKYNLRPGMGLAAPQLGVNERFFVVCHEEEENKFKNYIMINPEMISNSEELIYASEGEGCLSVNREVQGIVPRYARVTFKGYDIDGNPIKIRAREELAIAFQHELDHLNGILFVDHIDPKDPYKNKDYMREI